MLRSIKPAVVKLITAVCGILNFAMIFANLPSHAYVMLAVIQGATFLFVSVIDQYYSSSFMSSVRLGENKYKAFRAVTTFRSYYIYAISIGVTVYSVLIFEQISKIDSFFILLYSLSFKYSADWALPYMTSKKYWLIKIALTAILSSCALYIISVLDLFTTTTVLCVYALVNFMPAVFIRRFYAGKYKFHYLNSNVQRKNIYSLYYSVFNTTFYNLPFLLISLPKFSALAYDYAILWRLIGFVIQFIPPIIDDGIVEHISKNTLSRYARNFYKFIAIFSVVIFIPLSPLKLLDFQSYNYLIEIFVENQILIKIFVISYACEYATSKFFLIDRDKIRLETLIVSTSLYILFWVLIYIFFNNQMTARWFIFPTIAIQILITLSFLVIRKNEK